MQTRYYLFGGQQVAPAYRWKGYPLPGLSRVAAETRGLSGPDSGLSGDPEVEYLPYRASGPEPQDPGESGPLGLFGLSDNEKRFGMIAVIAVGAWFVTKRVRRK